MNTTKQAIIKAITFLFLILRYVLVFLTSKLILPKSFKDKIEKISDKIPGIEQQHKTRATIAKVKLVLAFFA